MIHEDDKRMHEALTAFLRDANSIDDGAYDRGRGRLINFINHLVAEDVEKTCADTGFLNGMITGLLGGAFMTVIVMMVAFM